MKIALNTKQLECKEEILRYKVYIKTDRTHRGEHVPQRIYFAILL